jgi:protein O-mannosyl-transferase
VTAGGRGCPQPSRSARALAFGLAVLTGLAYLPLARNGFVLFDDQRYITENLRLLDGVTAENLRWAFTTFHMGNWHPATWVSFLLDGRLYGFNPAGFHATNLLLHVATTLLLFHTLRGMTGALWRSGAVAALFALHPQHVESVAWASERKDVLAGFFWLLTMAAYLRYARRPGIARYLPVLGCLALGLMSKALLVTLPFALLLLDYWPLGRWGTSGGRGGGRLQAAGRLLLEKAPLLALAAAASVVAYVAQQRSGAVATIAGNSLQVRTSSALFSYLLYLGKALWPADLAPLYHYHVLRLPAWISAAALVAVTAICARAAGTRPYLATGWLWFVGTLVPMIGLVQVGDQGIADRYTYIPLIGIFLGGTWWVDDVQRRAPAWRRPTAAAAAILLLLLAGTSFRQVLFWKDTVTLFRQIVAVSPGNFKAMVLLGMALVKEGQFEEANEQYRAALRILPDFPDLNANIAFNLYRLGKRPEAVGYLREEARIQPANPKAHAALGSLLSELGKVEEAKLRFREAVRLDPGNATVLSKLCQLQAEEGSWSEALACYEQVLKIAPGDVPARIKAREAAARLAETRPR